MNIIVQQTTAGGICENEFASTGSSNMSISMTKGSAPQNYYSQMHDSNGMTNTSKSFVNNKNPFVSSLNESSILDLDDTEKAKRKFKLTQRHLTDLTKKYALKRYGKTNDRMMAKYTEMTNRM